MLVDGCNHCCKRKDCQGACPINGPAGPGARAPQNLPPQGIPLDPVPGTNARSAPEILLPTPPPRGTSSYSPGQRGTVILGEPDFGTSPEPVVVLPDAPNRSAPTPQPPMIEDNVASPFPNGIANFAQVKDGVSSGLRPNLLDGFDWLQSNGYKTIVYLRNGVDDDSSDRKQAESRGIKYISLTVTPDTIKQELVKEFNRIVNATENRKLFVYDVNGAQSGAMWYLYFRTSEMLSNLEAIARAGRHGLKEKGDDEQIRIMTAVQKYISERKQ
jgi:protein tyrosine phosphatase (PTP) superfamily phosphohydrolase (DUF442 family)